MWNTIDAISTTPKIQCSVSHDPNWMPTLGRKPVRSSTIIAIAITPWNKRAVRPCRTTRSVPAPIAAPLPDDEAGGRLGNAQPRA